MALLVYVLARREAPRGLALLAWAVAALALAAPTGPHPYPMAMALALGCLLLLERSPVGAGVLVGLCALWRLEFAAYLGLGVVIGYLVRSGPDGPPRRAALRGAPAWSPALVTFAPVVLPRRASANSWDLLIRYPIEDFGDYQSLPFPLFYNAGYDFGSLSAARDTIGSILSFEVPLLLLLDLAAVLVVLALRFRRENWFHVPRGGLRDRDGPLPADASRTPSTSAPLAVVLAAPSAWVLAYALEALRGGGVARDACGRCRARSRLALVPVPFVAVVAVWLRARRRAAGRAPGVVGHGPGAPRRGRRGPRAAHATTARCPAPSRSQVCTLADLERAVRYVRAHVPPGRADLRGHPAVPTWSPRARRCSTCSPTARAPAATTSPRPAWSPRRPCSARSWRASSAAASRS